MVGVPAGIGIASGLVGYLTIAQDMPVEKVVGQVAKAWKMAERCSIENASWCRMVDALSPYRWSSLIRYENRHEQLH